jgi:predicted ArsR family transcriptional regulator
VPEDRRVHRALADGSRVALLRLLREAHEPLSTAELAKRTSLHPTTVRSHLEVLVDAELVAAERELRSSPGRPRILYEAVRQPPVEESGYRLLAEILASELAATAEDPSGRAVAAGAAWGGYLVARPEPFAAVTAQSGRAEVVGLLERLGFDPQVDGDEVRLRRCPFIGVARDHPDVVCAVHLGLMRGAITALGAPLAADELIPFAEPEACIARLRVASDR